jgi:hypothetical protein
MADRSNETELTGLLPMPLNPNDFWLSGQGAYELGECVIRCEKFVVVPGQKKTVDLVMKIISGPLSQDPQKQNANAGREIRKRFTMDNPKVQSLFGAIVNLLSGGKGIINGQPNVDYVKGTVFKGTIFSRNARVKNKQNGKDEDRTFYDIDYSTAVVQQLGGPGATPGQGGNAAANLFSPGT